MPHWVMAAVFAPLGALAVWSFFNDLKTGVAASRGWTFRADDNPIGFGSVLAGKVVIVAFCAAEAAFGLGLMADPVKAIQSTLHLG